MTLASFGPVPRSVGTARADLAACFRWTARLNMHEGIANHFSYAVSTDGTKFLINPYARHFSQMHASDLILLDANDPASASREDVDPTAWCIHGAIHRRLPTARCVMHVHSRYATVLATLEDSRMLPIDQNTMRYFDQISYDNGFDGLGLGDEAERLATAVENKPILLMANHGFMAVGDGVASAFDHLYYFERACQTLINAYQTGRALRVAADAVAAKTARQWREYPQFSERHLAAIREILDVEEPDYRD